MNSKKINKSVLFGIVGLLASASLAQAQTPVAVPTSNGSGQTKNIVCASDWDCNPGLKCYKGECFKSIDPTILTGPTATSAVRPIAPTVIVGSTIMGKIDDGGILVQKIDDGGILVVRPTEPTMLVQPLLVQSGSSITSSKPAAAVPTAADNILPRLTVIIDSTVMGEYEEKPISPNSGVITGPTISGQGIGSLVPSTGKCPDRYLTSDDGSSCLKIDAYAFPTQPAQLVAPTIGGEGQTTVKPSDGVCPSEYTVSSDGNECLKPSVPTLFVSPTVSAPSVTFTSANVNVLDRATKKEISVSTSEGFKAIVDSEQPVAVQKEADNTISVSRAGVSVPVASGQTVKLEEGKITVSGQEVKVMPDTATTIAGNELKADIRSMSLESGDTVASYKVEATRELRILGLFKVSMPISASVNAQTSAVEKISKPWWSFLAF